LAFSRSVRWRLVSGSLDRSLALKPALTFVLGTEVAARNGAAPIARARLVSGRLDGPLALKPALTLVLWTEVAACDGAVQMARARLAAAAEAVVVFQLGTLMLVLLWLSESEIRRNGLSPGVVTFASGTVRKRDQILVIAESYGPNS
jgi:hypothetical protein